MDENQIWKWENQNPIQDSSIESFEELESVSEEFGT